MGESGPGRGGLSPGEAALPCPEQPQLSFLFLPTSEGSPLGWAGHVGCSFQSTPEGLQGGRGLGSLGLLPPPQCKDRLMLFKLQILTSSGCVLT